ncbi:MAG: metallophosphoesterase [Pseudomonadota bacterium]
MKIVLQILALTATALLALPGQTAGPYEFDTDSRVIAFGDVHGAYDDWVALLQELGVVDAELNWAAGDTHLVSLGDLIDRGPGSRQVVALMIRLDSQARRAGGAVHTVLGNHEVMVLTGELRYVSDAEFAAFAGDETAADREAAYAQYRRFNPGGAESDVRQAFDTQYPAGYFALRKAYSRGGQLGNWLAGRPFAIRVNDRVYTHAGISQDAAAMSLEALNQKLSGELNGFMKNMDALREAGVMPWHVSYDDRLNFLNARAEEYQAANPKKQADWFKPLVAVFEAQKDFVHSDDSPVWYRGTALCHPYSESFNTERFLKRAGAKQLVVGHTPTKGHVHERMEGLAIRLDTGMLSSVYKGRASAMIIEGDQSYIRYLGDPARYQPEPEPRSLSQRFSNMSDTELEDFMVTAEVISVEDIGTGITKPKRVRQQRGDVVNDAAFKYLDTNPDMQNNRSYISRRYNDSDRYIYDVAAYKLDRMLDLQMVPVSVEAVVDGDDGALTDWMENTINERDRLEEEIPFTSYCDQWQQYRLRFVFDILTFNEDRNLTNILWTRDDFMMKFIDHSLAFRSSDKRPSQYRKVTLEVSDLLRGKLESLDRTELDRQLSPYLHPRQIEAILERRDRILKEAESP